MFYFRRNYAQLGTKLTTFGFDVVPQMQTKLFNEEHNLFLKYFKLKQNNK